MLPGTQLDLDDLRVVHAIVIHRGATRAAAHLALSQSAVSHRLRLVEDRLGCALFERRGRRLEPLPAARRLASTAEQLIPPLSELEAELHDSPGLPPLRLTVQCYTGYQWFPPVLTALTTAHPELTVEVVPEATCDPLDALSVGTVDVAVCGLVPRKSRLVFEPLFTDELVAVLPPTHPLVKRKWIGGEALTDEQVFLFELSQNLREHFTKRLFPNGGGFRRIHRVPLTEAIVAMVRSGAGVSILPRWSVADAVSRGEVAVVRLTRAGLKRHWHAVYSARSPLRNEIETLVALLASAGAK